MPGSSSPPPGTVLDDRFAIRRRLGSGNFGAVYLADQQVFDLTLRSVALKLFHREMVTEENAREQLNDAVILMRLQQESSHPEVARHLVTVLDAGFLRTPAPQAFVSMEYVPGYPIAGGGMVHTLHGLIRAFRPVPVDLALRWMTQILHALAWMHTLDPPVLHCDLKADNILPDGKDTLKVADFGLAQLAFGAVGTLAAAGAVTCQSPETLSGILPTPASDVYSLGLLLYEMLAGRNPLAEVGLEATAADDHGAYLRQQIEARRAGLPPLVEAKHPELADHPLLSEIVSRCLRFRATERYDNAAMLLKEIEAYAAGRGVALPPRPSVDAASETTPAATANLERLLSDAEALRRQGRLAEGQKRAEEALTRFPDSADPYRWLAQAHLAAGNWEETLSLCAAALKLPRSDQAELIELSAAAYDEGRQPQMAARMRGRAATIRRGTSR